VIGDALENIFVDVSNHEVGADADEYSDEEEAQFHAQYQEKHFVRFIEALNDIVAHKEQHEEQQAKKIAHLEQ